MAAVEITISGVLYDKLSRTTQQVVLVGDASLTGLGIGGGPMPPGQGGGSPPGIWGPTDPRPTPPIALPPGYPGQPPGGGGAPPYPAHPIYDPPHIWGPTDPRPQPPIYYPPNVPPSLTPPQQPNPGDPVTPVPPPEGSQGWPVQPIVPPPYIVVNYPGVGPVTVPAPLTAQPKPQ